jgi:CRP-like cAMP-binding protein
MARHAYHDHLREVPLFADLDADELDAVGRTATELRIDAGGVLMHQGDVAHDMMVVVDGTVEVTRDGEHVADVGPGGFVGEMALLSRGRRSSTVTAKTAVTVIHIDGRSFASLLDDVPRIAVKMLPVVAGRVTASSDHHTH